jgi:hypothetical protein
VFCFFPFARESFSVAFILDDFEEEGDAIVSKDFKQGTKTPAMAHPYLQNIPGTRKKSEHANRAPVVFSSATREISPSRGLNMPMTETHARNHTMMTLFDESLSFFVNTFL